MKWQYKARIQNLIASLPIADGLYYAVQRAAGGLRTSRLPVFEWLQSSASIVAWILSAGGSVAENRFLEVGTGRTVTIPLGLWLCGAGPMVSVDVNRYLSGTLTSECNHLIQENSERVREILRSYKADLPDVSRTLS